MKKIAPEPFWGGSPPPMDPPLIHSKLDYSNSPFLNLPKSQLDKLQSIINSAARAITSTSKYSRTTPILKSLHLLKIKERIHYKLLSLTYSVMQFNQSLYLRTLLNIQSKINTRSSSSVTLLRPTNPQLL